MKGVYEDLSGKDFGSIHVIRRDYSKGGRHVYYSVRCTNCGRESLMRVDGIKRSPDHCNQCKYPDLTGMSFGMLTALGLSGRKDSVGHKYYDCLCQCGNTVEVLGTNLTEGHTTNCGCVRYQIVSQKESKDVSGQRFGKLTAIKRTTPHGEKAKWMCACDCGNLIEVVLSNLSNGHTQSCGCMRSSGEYSIRNILDEINIPYIPECRFRELPKRRFDFAILDDHSNLKCLIEYDGKQHYEYTPLWHNNEDGFRESVVRDNEKDSFCRDNGIKLYRIRYDDVIAEAMDTIVSELKALPSTGFIGNVTCRILERSDPLN